MSGFAEQLRSIATRLPVPEPARSRILLEMATDMDDLFQHFLEQGMGEREANSNVAEQFDLSDEALLELARVHTSPLTRSLEGLSGQARRPWERVVLGLVAIFVMVGLGGLLVEPRVFLDASPVAYLLGGLLLAGTGLGVWKAHHLFLGQSAVGPVSRRGLRMLPGLSMVLVFVGMVGVWVELYRSALVIRSDPGIALVHLVHWLHLASATLVVAFSGALLTALLWFFLENRATHLEEKAAAKLLERPA